jgi:transcription elongation GreA/GreB family factor
VELPEILKTKNSEEIEGWFLDNLSAKPLPFDDMLAVLSCLGSSGKANLANNWAELLQDTVVERGDKTAIIKLLQLMCNWQDSNADFRSASVKALHRTFKGQIGQGVVNSAGFEGNVEMKECLRRLEMLISLKPGILCRDKTWGFGVVSKVDDFYLKATIDFDNKPGHVMTFSYVGEALEVLKEDHLLAVKHRKPDEFAALLKDDPAEVVRMAIRSFGPLSVQQLRELFVGNIMPDAGWKSFWETARKRLKDDPLVSVPSGRDKPIRLLDREADEPAELLALLKQERDMETILDLVRKLERECGGTASLSNDAKQTMGEKLAFALKGARGNNRGVVAMAVMIARRLDLPKEIVDVSSVTEEFFVPEVFLDTTVSMPARELEPLLNHLKAHDGERTQKLFLSLLPQMQMSVLNDAVNFLISEGKQSEFVESMRAALQSEGASLEMLYWLCRHLEEIESWSIGNLLDIVTRAIVVLEVPRSGKALNTQKQLRSLFLQKAWVEQVLGRMDARQRENLLSKINVSRGWEVVDKRAVMGAIVKLYPDLARVLTSEREENEPQEKPEKFTSWRSYKLRIEQLRKLLEIDIPANSRDIGVAISHGDISENAEYTAAKDHQGILMRRRAEWELGLREIKGTDFSGFSTGKAGLGTCVAVQDSQGRIERFNILGEWDGDESLGIISSKSAVAKALYGRKVGDEVILPSAAAEEKRKIIDITGLSGEVRKWITGS